MTHSIRLSSAELLLVIKALRVNSLEHFLDKEMARNLADKLMKIGCSNVALSNLERKKMNKIIAVDFDGTLFTNAWPNVGDPITETIEALKKEIAEGAEVILWTNRVGDKLDEALDACAAEGIIFDAVNENLPRMVEFFGGDPRKVFANEYWDDRAIRATSHGLDVREVLDE